jgi:hypothetical protein
MSGFKNRTAMTAGLLLLYALPVLAGSQSVPPGPAPNHQVGAPLNRSTKPSLPPDDFAGLTYTQDQQAKIDQIHRDMKEKMDIVVKDEKLSGDQKAAFLDGFGRMERRQVFLLLTPEQRSIVRNRELERRSAEKDGAKKRPAEKEVDAK